MTEQKKKPQRASIYFSPSLGIRTQLDILDAITERNPELKMSDMDRIASEIRKVLSERNFGNIVVEDIASNEGRCITVKDLDGEKKAHRRLVSISIEDQPPISKN